ncbi:hypothetical protein PVAP13_6NG355950 [Panicum virgatum]|uniref:Uncharacterized protein n=1 Tax=Panicum virgatum TaxID=38727 RepID=A0A8T0R4Q1_PANVG|nr:hypothetical protein PVAP13_6NG355950 [Panicum virgatum]
MRIGRLVSAWSMPPLRPAVTPSIAGHAAACLPACRSLPHAAVCPVTQLPVWRRLIRSSRRPSARKLGLQPPPQAAVAGSRVRPPAADLGTAATTNASSPLPERDGD